MVTKKNSMDKPETDKEAAIAILKDLFKVGFFEMTR